MRTIAREGLTMVKHPLFGEVSENFNETAAMEVYKGFLADPDYYRTLLNLHAIEVVSKTILTEPAVVDALIIDKYNARRSLVKDAVLSGVVNKTMSNNTVDEVVAVMDLVSKAMNDYTEWERAENVKRQRRGPGGRFVKMGTTRIDIPQGATGKAGHAGKDRGYWRAQTKAYDNVVESKYGKRPGTVHQSGALNAAHSSAYLQIADALQRIDPTDMLMADITYKKQKLDDKGNYVAGGKPFTRTKVGNDVDDFIDVSEYGEGEIPTSITWHMDSESAGYGKFDILTGAGASTETALDLARAGKESGPALRTMNDALAQEYTSHGDKKYGQLGAVATMIETVGGDRISPQGKAALGAAKYVGEYGSEAEKVLGPTARRAAYRYRGTERKPDAKMDRAIMASVGGSKSINDAHERLIHPTSVSTTNETVTMGPDGQPQVTYGLDFEKLDEHSPFIKYWQNQLPKREMVQLHLDSGTTPPSQGVVFDRKGQIISQSVGYGDDHYLPFNLRKLSGANRGEWVRTRTMGGPTTEDISAALLTGTRAATVVSHSGVYVVEFDDSFRGGRRNNDKTRRMIRRYAQLLDTLDAESTTLQKVPPDRMEEIRDSVAIDIPGEGRGANNVREARIKELVEVERQHPTPSKAQRAEWTAEFGQKYADKLGAENEREISWSGVKANLALRNRLDEDPTDEQAIEMLGGKESYDKFMKHKQAEYRSTQAPLKLNGQGYYFALQALQEQFPYAIKRVEWYPASDVASADQGYVPHNFNRPKAAKEGFWNPEIEGRKNTAITTAEGKASGKIPAHHTNYQNFAARQRLGETGARPAAPSAPAGPNAPVSPTTPAGSSGGRTPSIGVGGFIVNENNTRERLATTDTAEAALALGDLVGQIPVGTGVAGSTERVPMKHSRLESVPALGDWDNKRNQLDDPAVLAQVLRDFEFVFEGQNHLARNVASQHPNLGQQYRDTVQTTVVKDLPRTSNEALDNANGNFIFRAPGGRIDERFLPGRDKSVYETELPHSDEDMVHWKNRKAKFTDFPTAFKAMERQSRRLSASTEDGFVEYAGRNYGKSDLDELHRVAGQDLMGYLKTRQVTRLAGGESAPVTGAIPDDLSDLPEANPNHPNNPSQSSANQTMEDLIRGADRRRHSGFVQY